MYDILAHHEAPLPDEINKQGFAVVTNPEIAIQEQKMAMENAKAQREEQQKLEGARQAKLEGDLGKLKDHSREADNPYFAKKISDFNQLVQDNIGDYYDKDIRKSSAAAMKIKEAANGLNSDIDYSNNLGKQEVYTDNLVDHNKPNYWPNDLTNWEANKKKQAFGDDKASISNAPEQRINLAKKWKEEVMPRLAQTGDVTPVPVNLGNGVVDIQYKINNADAVDREKNAFMADQTVDNYLTKHLDNSSKDTQDFFKNPNTGEYNKRALLDQLIPNEVPRQKDVAKTLPTANTSAGATPTTPKLTANELPNGTYDTTIQGKPTEIVYNNQKLKGTFQSYNVNKDGSVNSGVFLPEPTPIQAQQLKDDEIQNYNFLKAVAAYRTKLGTAQFERIVKDLASGKPTMKIDDLPPVLDDKGNIIPFPDRTNYPLSGAQPPKPIPITKETNAVDLDHIHDQLGTTKNEIADGIKNNGVKNKTINLEVVPLKKGKTWQEMNGAKPTNGIPTPTSKEEYDKLPSGAKYYKNGVLKVKS